MGDVLRFSHPPVLIITKHRHNTVWSTSRKILGCSGDERDWEIYIEPLAIQSRHLDARTRGKRSTGGVRTSQVSLKIVQRLRCGKSTTEERDRQSKDRSRRHHQSVLSSPSAVAPIPARAEKLKNDIKTTPTGRIPLNSSKLERPTSRSIYHRDLSPSAFPPWPYLQFRFFHLE